MLEQSTLSETQLVNFRSDKLTVSQLEHFFTLLMRREIHDIRVLVDVGGGCGHFCAGVVQKAGQIDAICLDSDKTSLEEGARLYNGSVGFILADALHHKETYDADIVTFNLVLHHLVGGSDSDTREIQKKSITSWISTSAYIFVNEYIYESYIRGFSARLIYLVTSNRVLSLIGSMIGRIAPSLNANTFGVGVRFREAADWCELFNEGGYEVLDYIKGYEESVSFLRRLLLIKSKRRDSFLIKRREN